jgi:hypothetical protein
MKHGMLVVVSLLLAVGCGRSPAARTPVTLVRVPADQVQVVEACACDDDEDDAAQAKRGVQYVPIDEWQPPNAVLRLEAKIKERGTAAPDYVKMPALTLHQPIPPTTFHGRRGYYYR